MTFLFIATLGPVQPFIASSRRTRDLFAGSALLSELSKAAARAIVEQEKSLESLIFPAPSDKDTLKSETSFNVANKIVAVIEQSPEKLGNVVRSAIKDRLAEVRKAAFKDIRLNDIDANGVEEQLDKLVEYAWVAVPFDKESHNYKHTHKHAEAVLSARKNTNFFREVTWGSNQEKSSIDGRLECVIPSAKYPKSKDTAQERATKAKYLYDTYQAGPHERLSAVDLIKRLGLKSMLPIVLSTSHIAATPFLERLLKMTRKDQVEANRLWNEYIQKVETLAPSSSIVERIPQKLLAPHPVTGNVDGALLFDERLLEDVVNRDEFPAAKEALRAFFRFTDARLAGQGPSPYYVVLLADGDGMGKAIEAQAELGPDGHREISKALALFAGRVSAIVKEHKGALVYAGGDDVLALLPLHTALACAHRLSEVFKQALSPFKDKAERTPTLSAGMAVVHHVSLLQDALTLVRKAERQAKNRVTKNSLAIEIQKRGGEPVSAVVSWADIRKLETLIELCRAEIIPGGMAYELRRMTQRLQTRSDDPEFETLQEIMQIEAARILRRKLYFSQGAMKQKDNHRIEQQLSALLSQSVSQEEAKKVKTLQEQARYFLLDYIGVKQETNGSFDVTDSKSIAPFIDTLIVAQVFAETVTREAMKGNAE